MADVYDVIPEPIKPLLPGVVVVRPTADELFDSLGADLMIHANNCVRSFGDFHLALSGGSTPMPFYKHLMIDPHYRDFPWKRTHLWIVDERQVGFDDERCNFTHIDEIIGQHSDIPREQVHPMLAMAPDADEQYELLLRQTLFFREKGQDRLDFVLLGMGGDGHTASLFPHSPALSGGHRPGPDGVDLPRLVLINNGPNVTPPDRVTMSYVMLNAARFVAVLVTGSGKRATVAQLVARRDEPGASADLPVLGIRPSAGVLRWYLDADACPTAPTL